VTSEITVMLAAVFAVSGSFVAVVVILVSIGWSLRPPCCGYGIQPLSTSTSTPVPGSSPGVTLTIVVGRAVLAPEQVTYHRVIGAVLLYLNIRLISTFKPQ
jgi:hypothetical protein